MQTRDQKYAVKALKHVSDYKDKPEKERNQYGGMAHKLPILIHTAGLAQALEFVNSRGKDPHKQLLADLGQTLDCGDLPHKVRSTSSLHDYMQLTYQVRQALLWYKRYAQSILDVDDASAGETGDEA